MLLNETFLDNKTLIVDNVSFMDNISSTFTSTDTPDVSVPKPAEVLPDLITYETRMLVNDVISCGFQPIVTLIGLAGNFLSITVLGYQGAREVTNIILICLTLVDLLYLIMWYGPMAECTVRRYDVVHANNVEVEYKAFPIMVATILGIVSRLYTCLIAVERYIAVLHPLKAPALLTRRRIWASCVILFILPIALGFHSYILFDIKETFSPKFNATIKYVAFSQFTLKYFDFVVLWNDLITAIPFNFLPIALVLYCTIAILTRLQRSRQHRLQMTAGREDDRKSAEQRQVTKVLISICIVFVICSLPDISVKISRLIFSKQGFNDVGRYQNTSFMVTNLSLLFSIINSSVNFIFYIRYSKKFTEAAKKIYCFWRKEKNSEEKMKSPDTAMSSISKDASDSV